MKRDGIRITAVVASLGLLLLLLALGTIGRGAQQSNSQASARTPESKSVIPSVIPYFIAEGSKRAVGYRPGDRELALWALQAWQRSAESGLQFAPASESAALIRLYWAEPGGGEYGETQPLLVNGRRGAAVFIRPDMESLGPDIARRTREDDLLRESIVYLTCLHEFGHALGLDHTRNFADIMYFFGYGGDISAYFSRYRTQIHARSDIASASGLSDGDVKRIRAIYLRE
jgi:matrixin